METTITATYRIVFRNVFIPGEGKRPGKFTRRWLVQNVTTGFYIGGGYFKTKRSAQEAVERESLHCK